MNVYLLVSILWCRVSSHYWVPATILTFPLSSTNPKYFTIFFNLTPQIFSRYFKYSQNILILSTSPYILKYFQSTLKTFSSTPTQTTQACVHTFILIADALMSSLGLDTLCFVYVACSFLGHSTRTRIISL